MWNSSPKNAEKPVPEKSLAFLSKHQFEIFDALVSAYTS